MPPSHKAVKAVTSLSHAGLARLPLRSVEVHLQSVR